MSTPHSVSKRQHPSNNHEETPKRQKVEIPSTQLDATTEEPWVPFDPPVSSHTTRRVRNAAAWEERLPSLVYPLMKVLPEVTLNYDRKSPLWLQSKPLSSCSNNCIVEYKAVRVISFGCKIIPSSVTFVCSNPHIQYMQLLMISLFPAVHAPFLPFT